MRDDLRTRLSETRDQLVPQASEATFEGLQRLRRRRQQRRRSVTMIAALLIAAVSTAVAVRAFSGGHQVPAGPIAVSPAIGRSVKVGPQGQTSDMAAGFGKLWVAVYGVPGGGGVDRNALVEVDPQSMQVERTIPVPGVPAWETGGGGLVTSGDYLWIAASSSEAGRDVAALFRIDPNTGETTAYTWPGATAFAGVASDGTSLWLLGQAGSHPIVTRFDPGTAVFSEGVQLAGDAGRHIQAVPGEVIVSEYTWVQGQGPCLSLASIEPSTTPALRAEFPADPCTEENTVGLVSLPAIGGDVWNLYKGAFTTIDPATAEPRPVESPGYPPVSPRSDPVVSETGVWFGDYPGGNGGRPDILSQYLPASDTVEASGLNVGWSVGVATDDTLWAMGWDGMLTEITLTAVAVSPVSGSSTSAPSPELTDPFSSLTPGWTRLADPPELRCCAATAWTGSEFLLWGGHVGQSDKSTTSGWIYDPTADSWSPMPEPAALGPRSRPASVWTGKELLVWGGADFSTPYPYHVYADGAAFDPSTGRWSEPLPPAPIDARQPFAVWTGTEMIVWGSQDREQRRVDGAAYDPASNTWRRIADAPVELTDATAVWTGQEMIVFGAALHGGNHAETNSAIGIAYDPAADSWRELPDSNLDTNANTAIWIGDGLLAWDYNLDSQIYDPVTDRWSDAGKVPTDECEDVPTSVWAGAAYGKLCGGLVRFDPGSGTWEHIDAPGMFPTTISGAGDTLLVGGVYGSFSEGEDLRLFAYTP